MKEKIIKSKERVQKHGEVFTPRWVVEKMLDQDGVRQACEQIKTTFLEPSVGEGIFLIAILERKLKVVKKKYGHDLSLYESFSLLALSSLYGIELLEDNVQVCTMNLYQLYYKKYEEICELFSKKPKDRVLRSARTIISVNIEQGDFLSRKKADGSPIIITNWKANINKTVKVVRTESSLEDIFNDVESEAGTIYGNRKQATDGQLSMFDLLKSENEEEESSVYLRYKECDIRNVYKEELEEIDGGKR